MSSKKEGSFWLAVAVGFVMMVSLGIVPVIGPLVAGLVAGLIAGGGVWNGGKAGFLSGLIGAVILSVLAIVGSVIPARDFWTGSRARHCGNPDHPCALPRSARLIRGFVGCLIEITQGYPVKAATIFRVPALSPIH